MYVCMQVMLTKNTDIYRGLVNGARGVVKRFDSNKGKNYSEIAIPVVLTRNKILGSHDIACYNNIMMERNRNSVGMLHEMYNIYIQCI